MTLPSVSAVEVNEAHRLARESASAYMRAAKSARVA
jgi:hypothetical protein